MFKDCAPERAETISKLICEMMAKDLQPRFRRGKRVQKTDVLRRATILCSIPANIYETSKEDVRRHKDTITTGFVKGVFCGSNNRCMDISRCGLLRNSNMSLD